MKHENWTIAYRKKDVTNSFKIIPNTWRYWCADPHLFEKDGQTYIFAELYDRILRRGVIGCCEIRGEEYSRWNIVLKTPYHLSYPHVFSCETDIYMIPESYVAEEIALFKAVDFPNKWEKVCVLKDDFVAVDSTLFAIGDKKWIITLQCDTGHECLKLFEYDDKKIIGKAVCIAIDNVNKRPAGKLFYSKEKLIRPAQDCSKGYGCALNFYEVTKVDINQYEEKLIRKVFPEEIVSDLKVKPQGIHTYNQSKSYEVIDLKGYETDWLFYIMRPIWFVWRRIRKVLK